MWIAVLRQAEQVHSTPLWPSSGLSPPPFASPKRLKKKPTASEPRSTTKARVIKLNQFLLSFRREICKIMESPTEKIKKIEEETEKEARRGRRWWKGLRKTWILTSSKA